MQRSQLHTQTIVLMHWSEIWMHLWPNAYSSGRTALAKQQYRDGDLLMYYAYCEALGGIDDLNFKVNGDAVSGNTNLRILT